jgi:diaminopimelate dehydrogenase
LGKGVETAIAQNPDMELAAIFTRRKSVKSLKIKSNTPIIHIDNAADWKGKIDVMILCGGSANDLPEQTPELAKLFNTVDSFDNHGKIPEYFKMVDTSAKSGNNVSIISIGWDPGLFSLMRLYGGAIIPNGNTHTFWGPGVSQGHSEAIRGVDGVVDGVQYTIPIDKAKGKIRTGDSLSLTPAEKHTRLCYVVTDEGEDINRIKKEIQSMPNYFADYKTTVKFISLEELKAEHSKLPHGGNVIHIGKTGGENNQIIEFDIKLDSNPEFTASVLLAYARAAYKLSIAGESGARTIFDIPPILLSGKRREDIIKNLL